jgi:hypothetical protein
MGKIIRLTESELITFVKKMVEHVEYHDVDEMYGDRVEDVIAQVVLKYDARDFDGPRDFANQLIDIAIEILMEKYGETIDDEDRLRDEIEMKYTKPLINYWYSNSGDEEEGTEDDTFSI